MTPLEELYKDVIELGRECAVGITGDPDDAADIQTQGSAMEAIKESIRLGRRSHNLLTNFRYRIADAMDLLTKEEIESA